jgi:DNA replication protein DnaC
VNNSFAVRDAVLNNLGIGRLPLLVAAQVGVCVRLVRRLHGLEFADAAHDVVLIGGPGTGKTHLATAIGIEAIRQHGKRVRFFNGRACLAMPR